MSEYSSSKLYTQRSLLIKKTHLILVWELANAEQEKYYLRSWKGGKKNLIGRKMKRKYENIVKPADDILQSDSVA